MECFHPRKLSNGELTNRSLSERSFESYPGKRSTKIVRFNEKLNRKMKGIFSSIDWNQVNHYMEKLV